MKARQMQGMPQCQEKAATATSSPTRHHNTAQTRGDTVTGTVPPRVPPRTASQAGRERDSSVQPTSKATRTSQPSAGTPPDKCNGPKPEEDRRIGPRRRTEDHPQKRSAGTPTGGNSDRPNTRGSTSHSRNPPHPVDHPRQEASQRTTRAPAETKLS